MPETTMRRSAFTLMELLMVITIIMILMGMVMGGVMYAKKAALRTKTSSTLAALSAALSSYRTVSGMYPYQNIATPTPGSWTGDFSSFETTKAYSGYSSTDWVDINNALASALNLAGESFKIPVNDAWKQPFHYRPARFYPYLATPATKKIDSEDPPGRDSFQLWSIGQDKIDDAGEDGHDDLTSWGQ